MCSRAVLVTLGPAVVGGGISMESLDAGAQRSPPATIRAAEVFLAGAADARTGQSQAASCAGSITLEGGRSPYGA